MPLAAVFVVAQRHGNFARGGTRVKRGAGTARVPAAKGSTPGYYVPAAECCVQQGIVGAAVVVRDGVLLTTIAIVVAAVSATGVRQWR